MDYYLHGGILPYVLRQLIEQDTVRQTAELLDSLRPVHAAANGRSSDSKGSDGKPSKDEPEEDKPLIDEGSDDKTTEQAPAVTI